MASKYAGVLEETTSQCRSLLTELRDKAKTSKLGQEQVEYLKKAIRKYKGLKERAEDEKNVKTVIRKLRSLLEKVQSFSKKILIKKPRHVQFNKAVEMHHF
jgi:glycyl-tRNA synthetase beta subunit